MSAERSRQRTHAPSCATPKSESRRHWLSGSEDAHLSIFGKHHAEHLLEGEKVDARTPTLEVVAGATPLTAVEPDVMGVVIATECEREPVDGHPIELSRVAIRLLDLADQGAVHRSATSVARVGARGAAVRSAPRPVMAVASTQRVHPSSRRGSGQIGPAGPARPSERPSGSARSLAPEVVLEADDVVELRRRDLHELGPLDRLVAVDPAGRD